MVKSTVKSDLSVRNIQDQEIPPEIVENVLNEKCFNGKSFMEIERQITVEVIY